ncbi:SHOCT domain-containing protein [Stenotrophomonas sp.]|uniref:SHOCT domain-containing protein n=1 Tax=Stenotrophomonas sp. TaxID=69392 RepID=UPI0028AA3FAD|nr:SHOCT domain-containing protein [Stenotrophomonas sp.]
MGALSIWHLLVLLFLFALAASVVGLIVWLVKLGSRKPGNPVAAAQRRLQQLDELKAKGVITDEEYARQRAAIVTTL